MKDLSGLSIGRYHIIEKLGEGGMALVYKAYDTRLECEVAVKVIRTDQLTPSAIDRALKRFEREAKAVAKLNHPYIVMVSDLGEFEGNPYLVMPYLPGGTLKRFIKLHGQIPWQEAIQLLIPITEALAYAHSQNIIHRDIKPSNILLTQIGKPMLSDFGVAKIINDESTLDLTSPNTSVGTPEYMAPEQVTNKMVDQRADIYSLGIVFYEMIAGRAPFVADTPIAVLFKQASDPLPRPSRFIKDLPVDVERVIVKALAKDPNERYQSMEEMSKALERLVIPKESKHLPWQKIILASFGFLLALLLLTFGMRHIPNIITSIDAMQMNETVAAVEVAAITQANTPALNSTATSILLPTQTRSPTLSSTPSPPFTSTSLTPNPYRASLILNANVRTGPGTNYNIITSFPNGSSLDVIGRDVTGQWLVIWMPDLQRSGWISAALVTLASDINTIPIVAAPPTPIPIKTNPPEPSAIQPVPTCCCHEGNPYPCP